MLNPEGPKGKKVVPSLEVTNVDGPPAAVSALGISYCSHTDSAPSVKSPIEERNN